MEIPNHLLTSAYRFALPEELIAQHPLPHREQSRLLVLERRSEKMVHRRFADLPEWLGAGDVLVLNNSKVLRARLRAENPRTGGHFELLLLPGSEPRNHFWCLMRPARRAPAGTRLAIVTPHRESTPVSAVVLDTSAEGHRLLRFEGTEDLLQELERLGEVPLPPYIKRPTPGFSLEDAERYQTVYAQADGSVAAPTAGLHFSHALLKQLEARGVQVCYLTLHVGWGTFAPVKPARVRDHRMHEEFFHLESRTAEILQRAKLEHRRIVAVGTTTVRTLEAVAANHGGHIVPGSGRTGLFIYPPFQFRIVDALVTNFHLPSSTLLMLVCAFAGPGQTRGRELILRTYAEAVRQRYRFFSYGDAMLLL